MKILDEKKKKRIKIIFSFVKLLLLIAIVIALPIYIYFNHHDLIDRFNSLDEINLLLDEYKIASVFIYIGLQIFQIIVSILPGQALQFSAGYAYGFWIGFLLSMIGVMLGTIITFYLARLLGKEALYIIFGEEKFSKFVHTLNTKKSYLILFVIFLIPGIPKDIFAYAAGISEIRITSFLLISLVGRTPAMIGSLMMGKMFYNESYVGLIILGILAAVLFIAGIANRKNLMKWIDQVYFKMAENNK